MFRRNSATSSRQSSIPSHKMREIPDHSMEPSGVQSLVVWQIARAIVLFPAQAPAAPWENEVGGRRSMVKKVISFALIGVFSSMLLVACGQPSDKVEPTVTREAVEIPETTASTPAAPEGTTAASANPRLPAPQPCLDDAVPIQASPCRPMSAP